MPFAKTPSRHLHDELFGILLELVHLNHCLARLLQVQLGHC